MIKRQQPVQTIQTLPLFRESVSAGFPSPASDHHEAQLDLNGHLINSLSSTLFFVRADGDSMPGAGDI